MLVFTGGKNNSASGGHCIKLIAMVTSSQSYEVKYIAHDFAATVWPNPPLRWALLSPFYRRVSEAQGA